MELARALKKQLESLKHQGAQEALQGDNIASADDVGKRSNQIVAERNGMSVKQVQRHIALTNLSLLCRKWWTVNGSVMIRR